MAGAEAQTRSASAGLRLLAIVTALSPAPALAGAWIAPEGGQSIATSAVGQREDGITFYEGAYYFEAPMSGDTSVVLAPWSESNHQVVDGWRAEATLGAKHVVYRSEQSVVAFQGSALWYSDPGEGCSEGGAELRVLAGHSFAEGQAFANVEGAARALDGGCEGLRGEFSAGYRHGANWLTMGQVFLDSPIEGEETLKAQVSVVRFGRSGRGIQLGVRARIDGEDPEAAVVLAFWSQRRD